MTPRIQSIPAAFVVVLLILVFLLAGCGNPPFLPSEYQEADDRIVYACNAGRRPPASASELKARLPDVRLMLDLLRRSPNKHYQLGIDSPEFTVRDMVENELILAVLAPACRTTLAPLLADGLNKSDAREKLAD